MSAPRDSRQVSLGPGIPRVDVEPLDLVNLVSAPAQVDVPTVCPVCCGTRLRPNPDPEAEASPCSVCEGRGSVGGRP